MHGGDERAAVDQVDGFALGEAPGIGGVITECDDLHGVGAVVGQQPFGGARGSGTNDKAGSMINLLRWVSPRAIKEAFDPPKDYRYPFLGE